MSKLELTDEQMAKRLAEALDYVSQLKDVPDVHECDISTLHRNDLERMHLWDLAAVTANVPAKMLESYPLYAKTLILKSRRIYPQFDPAWRKAHSYPEVI